MVDISFILVATIASIIAAILVARGRALTANSIWAVSNIIIIWHNLSIGEYEMVILFGAYEIIAIYGIYYLWGQWYIIEYKSKKKMQKLIKEYKDNEVIK